MTSGVAPAGMNDAPAHATPGQAPGLAVVGRLLGVLVRPIATLRQPSSASNAAVLIFAILAIDFVVALLLMPSLMQAFRAQWTLEPGIAAGTKVMTIGVAVLAGSLINLLIMLAVSVLLFLALFVIGAKARFADLTGSLLVASAPLIAERFLKAIAWYFAANTEAWRRAVALDALPKLLGLPLDSAALHFFSLFDVWALALMVLAIRRAAAIGWFPAIALLLLIWGSFQGLLFQLYVIGYIK